MTMSNAPLSPQRILVLRALQLGDMLCAVPALRALRARHPSAHIRLLGLPWAHAFVERFSSYVDALEPFPGYPGLPEQPARIHELPDFLAALHRHPFDLAIQMHGGGIITNPLLMLLGARAHAGYHVPGVALCPDPDGFMPYPNHVHEIRRHLALMRFLGVESTGEHLEFPLWERDHLELRTASAGHDFHTGSYVCIHPGARMMDKRWWAKGFAHVADELARQGLGVVLTGSGHEVEVTQAVAGMMQTPAVDTAGWNLGLGPLAALLARARLVVCNDTGVSHLAAALRVPSVVVFTNSDIARWAPLDAKRHRPVVTAPGEGTARVMDAVQALLEEADERSPA